MPSADRLMDELLMHPRRPADGMLGWYHRWANVHQHKWMYDGYSLDALLRSAGFEETQIYRSSIGRLPQLHEVERPARIVDGAGVAVEGLRP
jgi:hypothetical protein